MTASERLKEIEGRGFWTPLEEACHAEVADNFDWLISRVHTLEKRNERLREASQKMLNKINVVTAYHRHGQEVPKTKLDDLCDRQLEFEKALEDEGVKE